MYDLLRALEDTLVAKPDDLASHSAYANLLGERGDPRGEFIRAQLALERGGLSSEENVHLRQRETELLAGPGQAWLRPILDLFPDAEPRDVEFERGWVSELYAPAAGLAQAHRLAALPEVRLLRRLHVTDPYGTEPPAGPPPETTFLGNVRVFELGFEEKYRGTAEHGRSPAILFLVSRMPRLEKLHLYANEPDVAALFALPNLTRLRVLRYERGTFYP